MGQRRFASSVWPLHHRAPRGHLSKNNKKAIRMPSRGYRKGVSDSKRARPHVIKARISSPTYTRLNIDCDVRAMTLSTLVDRVLEAYVAKSRVELPHPQPHAPTLRELCRIGNNLNQIAHQANVMNLPLIQQEARDALAAVMAVVRRL